MTFKEGKAGLGPKRPEAAGSGAVSLPLAHDAWTSSSGSALGRRRQDGGGLGHDVGKRGSPSANMEVLSTATWGLCGDWAQQMID